MTIAWAVMQPDSYSVFVSYDKAVAHRDICAGGDIIPLYRSPNLTDKEIEAIDSKKELTILSVVRDMFKIIDDPSISQDDKDMAMTTLREALK
jgi:hypothetical protein